MANGRLRRIVDLFVRGTEVALPDGTILWMNALNAFERDECLNDALAAKARFALACKEGGSERLKVEGRLVEHGHRRFIAELVEGKVESRLGSIVGEINDDPEWKERLKITERTNPEDVAVPLTQEEIALLDQINKDLIAEIERRREHEVDLLTSGYASSPDEELVTDWLDVWIERQGNTVANAEFRLSELWFATRYCQATISLEDGTYDHTQCGGHGDHVFASRLEAREIPDDLRALLTAGLDKIAMNNRDPKDSASQGSSSESSPQPSAAGE